MYNKDLDLVYKPWHSLPMNKNIANCVVPWISDERNEPEDWSLRGMYCFACAKAEFAEMKAQGYKVGKPVSVSSAEKVPCRGRSSGGKYRCTCESERSEVAS